MQAADVFDTGLNALVTYEILSGNDDSIFEIHPDTGVVRVASPQLVDFEQQREYKLILQARDYGFDITITFLI